MKTTVGKFLIKEEHYNGRWRYLVQYRSGVTRELLTFVGPQDEHLDRELSQQILISELCRYEDESNPSFERKYFLQGNYTGYSGTPLPRETLGDVMAVILYGYNGW